MIRTLMLRRVLQLDAATCVATGLLLAIGAEPIAALTRLPVPLLREAGIVLLPFALFVLWAARRSGGWPVQAVIAANIAWVAASLAVIASPWSGNAFGTAFVALQAAAVALLSGLQLRGLAQVPAAA